MSSSDIHALSGAYALDALDDIERAQFARHLAQCAECQAEVESLREAAAMLAETSSLTPPASLRDRVLADIKTVRPLPPVSSSSSAPMPGEGAPAAGAARPERRWLRGLVAAAAVVGIIAAGSAIWQPWKSDDNSVVARPSAADLVREAPDAVTRTQKLENGGEATVIASKSRNQVVVMTTNLPPLPEGKIYEMWLQDAEKGYVPAGLMTAEDATVVLDGDIQNAVGAGITVEPEGGSQAPTSKPVAEFSFENA